MIPHRHHVCILVLALLATACSRDEKPAVAPPLPAAAPVPSDKLPAVDGNAALARVATFIAIGPRESGSVGASNAATHIASELVSLGYAPIVDAFTNPTPVGPTVFRNVYAFRKGTTERTVILASHYDTRSGVSSDFSGANDSGSSTGLLLELARLLKDGIAPGIGIGFAFFDGEECMENYTKTDGLHGSRHLASLIVRIDPHPFGSVCAVVVLDMVGDKNLNIGIPGNTTPSLVSLVLKAAHSVDARALFTLKSHHMIDDHVPFTKVGIPAVDLIDYEFGSAGGLNDYWHTEADTLDKLSPDSLAIVGNVTLQLLHLLETTDPRNP